MRKGTTSTAKALSALGLIMSLLSFGSAQSFTYQGFLRVSGAPANAEYDFRFRLYTASTGGVQVGPDVFADNLSVQNGLFTTDLNFGAVWDGSDRYLEIAVRPGPSTGAYTVLSPRVKINPTPYAIRAATAAPIGTAGGDLTGTYPNPAVARLQGRSIATLAPSDGQVLKWSATNNRWEPASDLRDAYWQGVFNNIYFNTGNVGIGTNAPVNRLHVETAGGTRAIYAVHTGTTGTNYGVYGVASSAGAGVYGVATATSGAAYGVRGDSSSPDGIGVVGITTASTGFNYGVYGLTNSTSGRGVFGVAAATTGSTSGIYGQAASTSGTGVFGFATATTGFALGVYGETRSTGGAGVYGYAPAGAGSTSGVYGRSDSPDGVGVYGIATAVGDPDNPAWNYGVYGESSGFGGVGVYGRATSTQGAGQGVYGVSISPNGRGVVGEATATSGNAWGVFGSSRSPTGRGVYGITYSSTGFNYGVYGLSLSTAGWGVYGEARATTGPAWGVEGITGSSDSGAYGVRGTEPSGGAGHAVYAFGTFAATGTKSFQIDHPLRPETHYLNHFCAEGPEPYNIYRGTVTLDARGEAWVQLPDYFEAINRDPVVTLTPVGAPMPNLHVAVEVQGNRFKIAGGLPGRKVFWRVEAVRNDLWVQRYGYQTEQEKEDDIKGRYLNPELFGQPEERGLHYRPDPERRQLKHSPNTP